MYSALDADWREAAGILRSLSRKLPALTWVDFSGCGAWWDALMWHQLIGEPDADESTSSGDEYEKDQIESVAGARPDWNAAWRGVKTVVLKIGWSPVQPDSIAEDPVEGGHNELFYTPESYKKESAYTRELRLHRELAERQRIVILGLREVRREGGGAWIEFET